VDVGLFELPAQRHSLKCALDFAARMSESAKAFRELRPPVREAGESDADFAAREARWKEAPQRPEAWYERMEADFAALMHHTRGDPTPQLALLKLAGPDAIYLRGDLTLPGEAVIPTDDDEPLRLTLRHKGDDADWITDFSDLGYLHEKKKPASWVDALD
jgi:hypothetical protein